MLDYRQNPRHNEKGLQSKRSIHIRGPQSIIIELLKKFSEVIVASKCGLLARTEKQAIS